MGVSRGDQMAVVDGGQLALTASDKGPHVSLTENKSAPLKRYSVGENTDAILETCWAHCGSGRRGRSQEGSGKASGRN